jgi:hypothetical protein
MRVFAKIREELECRQHVFVTVRATRLVVVVMVMMARGCRNSLGSNGKRECALYGGIRSDRCLLGVIAVSAAGKTDVHCTWRHIRGSQSAAHGVIRRP